MAICTLTAGMSWAALPSEADAQTSDPPATPSTSPTVQRELANGKTSRARPVSARESERAGEARDRASRLRGAGDETHASIADGLAHEWDEAARDLDSAVAAEKMAAERRGEAVRAEAQLQRTRTLVEESIARIGRLRAELDAALASSSVVTKPKGPTEVAEGGHKAPPPTKDPPQATRPPKSPGAGKP